VKEFLIALLLGVAITAGCNFLPKAAPAKPAPPAAPITTNDTTPANSAPAVGAGGY